MAFDERSITSRGEDEVLNGCFVRFVNYILSHRTINDRQHFLGN